ncbi:uncharacterized protein LOC134248500 isoform X3 [Saccostrea cucullata]|uniref:uncharacterized protein LOC134248500 isoform X3 n=1 Tax=Saccostrea cuccullata TaxID=36930 RepID=UPI002ED101D4
MMKTESGFIICSLICLCHLQLSLTIKVIGNTRERLCSEDVVSLLHYLQAAPCKVTNETHVILEDAIEDLENCLITCEIQVSLNLVRSSPDTCVQQNQCPVTLRSTIESSLINVYKEFCCTEYKITAIVRGRCNYTLYKMDNLQLGERCISDMQCQSSNTRCLMSRCTCMPDYVEYDGRCISDETFENNVIEKNFRKHGDECRENFQCSYYGGVCSTTCSCISGYFFYQERCIEVRQLGDSCDIDEQCHTTSYLMTCLVNRCSCTPGFKEIDKMCVKADVKLQMPCRLSLQCSGTAYATVCHGGKCVCDFGFVQVEHYCQKTDSLQEMKSLTNNNVIAPAVGAGFSGLVIGTLLGILIMFLIQRRRSSPEKGIKQSSLGDDVEVYETRLQSKSVSNRDVYDQLENVKKENTNFHTTNKGGGMYSVIEPRTEPKDDPANNQPDDVGIIFLKRMRMMTKRIMIIPELSLLHNKKRILRVITQEAI